MPRFSYPEAQRYETPTACSELRIKQGAFKIANDTLRELARLNLVVRLRSAYHQRRGVDEARILQEIENIDPIAMNRIDGVC